MSTNTVSIRNRQIILHIPHSSLFIPEKYIPIFCMRRDELRAELLRMTDLYTDRLFDVPEVPESNRIVFPYSRLICDVERFRDDRMESMAARGMGVCYTAASSLMPLKTVTAAHKQEMYELYDRHHALLTKTVDSVLEDFGAALLIDCHSFASICLPYEGTPAGRGDDRCRPDFCIGTDPQFHTPKWVSDFLIDAFSEKGFSVAENYPFGGSLVPMKHYHTDSRVRSVMIEINRRLYMNEETGEKTAEFSSLKALIGRVIRQLGKLFYNEMTDM
ncbi:MAG: N-formylglutamate amidohydrolase [Eubacteriales bacterium]|nr:N-formylglutamate amidohydrolase [Eubacteriales bacterium]